MSIGVNFDFKREEDVLILEEVFQEAGLEVYRVDSYFRDGYLFGVRYSENKHLLFIFNTEHRYVKVDDGLHRLNWPTVGESIGSVSRCGFSNPWPKVYTDPHGETKLPFDEFGGFLKQYGGLLRP